MRPGLPRHGYVLCTLLVLSIVSFSQNSKIEQLRNHILADRKVASVQFSERNQTPTFILLKVDGAAYSKTQAGSLLANYLSVRPQVDNLAPTKTTQLHLGFDVMSFQQYYKGVKVEHADFKALSRNDQLIFFN